jgi:hypothetical protein
MRKFLKEVGLFFLVLTGVCLVVFGMQTWVIRSNANFKFSKNYEYLMVGHSHPQCAYNDSLIGNFKNISASGESYFYTYYKLKELLKDNDSVETVMIEFTNNQVDSAMDTWIWSDKSISQFYSKYGSFVNLKDQVLLGKKNVGSLLNSFSTLHKRNFMRMIKSDYSYEDQVGGYVHYEENSLETAKNIQKENLNPYSIDESVSINLLYLEKIVQLCRDRDKTIILIRTPQHKLLRSRGNEIKYLETYYSKFSDLTLMDFNDFSIPEYAFKDLGHLNYRGATIISETIDSLIKNKAFERYLLKEDKRIIITE